MSGPPHGRGRIPSFRRALSLVWSAGRGTFIAVVSLFVVQNLGWAALVLLGNALLHQLLAAGGASGVAGQIWWLVAVALAVAAAVSFAGATGAGLHRLLVERTVRHGNEIVFGTAAYVPLLEFDSPEFHDRLQRATQSGLNGALPVAMAVPQLAGAVVGGIALAGGLALVSPWLIPITLLASLPLWLSGRRSGEEMYSFSFGNTPNDRSRFNLEKIVKGRESAPEVRAFGLAPFLFSRWSMLYDERIQGIQEIVGRHIRRSALGSVTGSVVLGGVFALMLFLVGRGVLSLGSAAAACAVVLLLANRAQQAATSLAQVTENGLYLHDLLGLRDWARRSQPQPAADVGPFTTLSVSDVSFTYPSASTPALEGVSCDIRAGDVVAIVGQNGSGKTTMAKLLAGLYEPSRGTVCWDDAPLSEVAVGGGFAQVGVVFQDFGRYWFSAADNIGVGDVRRIGDRAGIERAAHEAGAAALLEQLPNGLDTPLAVELEGGTDLSVGQWQRVALARVLFRSASFIILDEPTASLDAEAEAALFETIRGLSSGRTVVLISHRFSTVRTASRILVLHQGRLVEQGSHEQLMALGGRYSHMYQLQSQPYSASSPATA